MLRYVMLLVAGFMANTAIAESVDGKRGYWWKEEPPAAIEEQEQLREPLGPPPNEEALNAMHPEDVEALIEDYRQNALWVMEPEQVAWYYQMQDYARRRARAFMNITELVMLENPSLNMNAEYPVNVPGQQAREVQRQRSLDNGLQQGREIAALVMLTRPDCPYCDAQRKTLKYFQQRHGWDVREIDIKARPDIGAKFATEVVPTTVVIYRNSEEWMPVAVGVESVPKLEENTYRALRLLRGDTSPQQFTMQEYQQGGLYDPQRSQR